MKTAEERAALLHKRTHDLERRRNRRQLSAWGSASAGLLVLLLAIVCRFAGETHGILDTDFAGASLLSESAGGYVLVAVVSFIAAMFITIICMRIQQKKTKPPDRDGERSIISYEEHHERKEKEET